MFGDVFLLGNTDEPLTTDVSAADVLVVAQSAANLEDWNNILARLVGLCKPTAAVILATDEATSAFEAKGFRRVLGVNGAALYHPQSEHTNNVNGNAPSKRDFVIIEPSTPSSAAKSFSNALQKALEEESIKSVALTWEDLCVQSADEAESKTYVSLVELETPMLDNLSEPNFDKVKKLVANSEHLLWVTGSDSPSMAVVDGLSRTARSENASLKFQVLHLSNLETALQHGPSLTLKLATSSTKDSEFREHNGLLQVSRFFNSVVGNEAVRFCLEDSVQVRPLRESDMSEALRLTIGKPGLLDSLAFIHDERFDTPLKEMEIEVDVKATGIK